MGDPGLQVQSYLLSPTAAVAKQTCPMGCRVGESRGGHRWLTARSTRAQLVAEEGRQRPKSFRCFYIFFLFRGVIFPEQEIHRSEEYT